MVDTKISKIVTRYPNLECGFFAALLTYFEWARRQLNITRGGLEWEFVSTARKPGEAPLDDRANGVISFNAGGGTYDQHGKTNEGLCRTCSLDLVRQDYDFLSRHKWLRPIYAMVRLNDLTGAKLSQTPKIKNLRDLMTGLTVKYPDNPRLVLDWLALAFCGVFKNTQAGAGLQTVFDWPELIHGVSLFAPDRASEFEVLLEESANALDAQWQQAQTAVAKAIKARCMQNVFLPALGQNCRMVGVDCDSVKTGPAARQKGFNLVIQFNTDGHCQIHGGTFVVKDDTGKVTERYRLDLGPVAAQLRRWEATFRGRRIAPNQNWEASGFILDSSGEIIPWYLPEYLSSVYNGTLSSRGKGDVSPTKFHQFKLMDIVAASLANCKLIRLTAQGEAETVNQSAGTVAGVAPEPGRSVEESDLRAIIDEVLAAEK